MVVAAYIEELTKRRSPATVAQHLARRPASAALFTWGRLVAPQASQA